MCGHGWVSSKECNANGSGINVPNERVEPACSGDSDDPKLYFGVSIQTIFTNPTPPLYLRPIHRQISLLRLAILLALLAYRRSRR